jgi:cell wall-associated NlpC family hydrolase
MIPSEVIDRLLPVPYAAGQGSWAGADCWGIVELWYRHVLSIDLTDRGDLPAGNPSVQQWAEAGAGWERITEPEDHCLALLRVGSLAAGHVGIVYGGSLLHSAAIHGCVYQPLSDRLIRAKTTGYLRRK